MQALRTTLLVMCLSLCTVSGNLGLGLVTNRAHANEVNFEEAERIFVTSLFERSLLFHQFNTSLLQYRIDCFSQNTPKPECENVVNQVRTQIRDYRPLVRVLLATYNLFKINGQMLLEQLILQTNHTTNTHYESMPGLNIDSWYFVEDVPYQSVFSEIPLLNDFLKLKVGHIQPTPEDYYKAINDTNLIVQEIDKKSGELVDDFNNNISWNAYMQKECLRFIEREPGINPDLCERFNLVFDRETHRILVPIANRRAVPFRVLDARERGHLMLLISHMRGRLSSIAKDIQDRMYRLIQPNAYIVLVSDNEPKASEIRDAFSTLKDVADEAYEKLLKRKRDYALNKLERKDMIDEMSRTPIVRHLVEAPSERMVEYNTKKQIQGREGTSWAAIANQLDLEYNAKINRQMMTQVGVAVGSMVACVFPYARVAGWAGKMVMSAQTFEHVTQSATATMAAIKSNAVSGSVITTVKNLCFPLPNVSINTPYFIHSWNAYFQIYGEFFASVTTGDNVHTDLNNDGHISAEEKDAFIKFDMRSRVLHELADIDKARSDLIWSAVFAPIGMWDTPKFAALGAYGISKATLQYMKAISPKLREMIKNADSIPVFMRLKHAQKVSND